MSANEYEITVEVTPDDIAHGRMDGASAALNSLEWAIYRHYDEIWIASECDGRVVLRPRLGSDRTVTVPLAVTPLALDALARRNHEPFRFTEGITFEYCTAFDLIPLFQEN